MNVQENYEKNWKHIIEKDGVIDKEQVKKELSDYSFVLANTTEIMDGVTDGRISKPFTHSFEVLKVVDDNKLSKAMVQDDIKGLLEYHDTLDGLKKEIVDYFDIK